MFAADRMALLFLAGPIVSYGDRKQYRVIEVDPRPSTPLPYPFGRSTWVQKERGGVALLSIGIALLDPSLCSYSSPSPSIEAGKGRSGGEMRYGTEG